MINLFDGDTPQPLIVLRGEYGIISGENSIIASPNAKSGTVIILSDSENKVTLLAHFDENPNLKESIEKMIDEMLSLGAKIENIKCNLTNYDQRNN